MMKMAVLRGPVRRPLPRERRSSLCFTGAPEIPGLRPVQAKRITNPLQDDILPYTEMQFPILVTGRPRPGCAEACATILPPRTR